MYSRTMDQIYKLAAFVRPYWKRSALALVLLTMLVFMDLAIPRLVQRIIDQGIGQHDQQVVIRTALLMLGISLLSTLVAIGNNIVREHIHQTLIVQIFGKEIPRGRVAPVTVW